MSSRPRSLSGDFHRHANLGSGDRLQPHANRNIGRDGIPSDSFSGTALSSAFHLEPPMGFRGLNQFEEIEIYTRRLPHWRQKGASYFVTFRLADSLPKEKLEELKQIKLEWQREMDAKEAAGGLTDQEKREAWDRLVLCRDAESRASRHSSTGRSQARSDSRQPKKEDCPRPQSLAWRNRRVALAGRKL